MCKRLCKLPEYFQQQKINLAFPACAPPKKGRVRNILNCAYRFASLAAGDHGALRVGESPPGHQFQSPATRRSAGPITMRTRVASMNTATASVNPSILTTRK